MRTLVLAAMVSACVTPSFWAGPHVAVWVHPQARVWPDLARVVQASEACVERMGHEPRDVMRLRVDVYPEGWSLPGKHAPLHYDEYGGFLEGDRMLLSRVGGSALDGAFLHELAHRTSGISDHGPRFLLAENELQACVRGRL